MQLTPLGSLFEVISAPVVNLTDYKANSQSFAGCIPHYSRKKQENGISGFIAKDKLPPEKINLGTYIVTALHLHPGLSRLVKGEFTTGDHMALLKPKFQMTDAVLIYYATVISNHQFRFPSSTRLNSPEEIKIPQLHEVQKLTKGFKEIKRNKLGKNKYYNQIMNMKRAEFSIIGENGLFDLTKPKRVLERDLIPGKVPHIRANVNKLGGGWKVNEKKKLDGRVTPPEGSILMPKNSISLPYNGEPRPEYQPEQWLGTDDVFCLTFNDKRKNNPSEITPMLGLFLCSVLEKNLCWKFGRTNKLPKGVLMQQRIILPVDASGIPAWKLMSKCMEVFHSEQSLKQNKWQNYWPIITIFLLLVWALY